MKGLFPLLLSLAVLGAEIQTDTRFRWKANTESDLAGYHLYFGPLPGFYTNRVTLSPAGTNTTLPALPAKTYFALTAFNSNNVESLPSREASTTNQLRISLSLEQAVTITGAWLQITNQIWVARSTNDVFFRGVVTIERVVP